jgi:Ca2+-binding EF-hand superfamily protein
MFEPPEILKMIFYVYDADKEGYIDAQELKNMMNMLHEIEAPETVEGTVKKAWQNLEFSADNKVDFKEFALISKQFPAIMEPAFKLQNFMMMNIL